MSTGNPPAPDVASISTSWSSVAPAGRTTGTATPVEVSLWAQAYTSTSGLAAFSGASPGAEVMTTGSPRKGALPVTVANLPENSP